MIYNTLGKTGLEVSRLGFGTMRLPTKTNNADIDTAGDVGMHQAVADIVRQFPRDSAIAGQTVRPSSDRSSRGGG